MSHFYPFFAMTIPNSRRRFSEDTGLAAVLPSFGTVALISFVALALVGAPNGSQDVTETIGSGTRF